MSRRVGAVALGLGAALALATASGCHSAVGSYFANRARDFGECFRFHLGMGVGLGGGVRGAGLADAGLGGGITPSWGGLSWNYGVGNFFGLGGPPGGDARDSGDLWGPGARWSAGHLVVGPCAGVRRGTTSFWLLPALAATHDDRWLWQSRPDPDARWLQLHAFDVEVSAWALILNVRVGFSFGEFVDFVAGWFGVDVGEDDHAWEPPSG